MIVKPRYGSGSFGVSRHARSPELSRQEYEVSDVTDYVFQPWIQSDTIAGPNGFEYYYDVRTFVCQGQIAGAVIRRSAAPRNGVAAATPLAWLTTSGSLLPISMLPCQSHLETLITATQSVIGRLHELR